MTEQTIVSSDGNLDLLRAETVQSRATKDPTSANFGVLQYLVRGAYLVPAWWSTARDTSLRSFWKKSDHLSGALYTMESKMSAIPFRVVTKDTSNRRWVMQAQERTETLLYNSEFGAGWQIFYPKFLEDLLSQDNGAFAEIIGAGDPTGPLIGAPIGLAHLDAARCQLTGHPVFPVIYRDDDGKLYKLHYTRVIHVSQMTSPIREMNGVGFCAVSRCLNTAQNLSDILTYKQEKLGSRPHRALMVTKGGLDPDDIEAAFSVTENIMDSQGLSRYSRMTVVGERNIPDADVEVKDLSGLPDGFDEQTSTTLGMATIALAFGTDARELFPAMSAGATRADAVLQHLKQRGKGPGQIIQAVTAAINYKFLPRHLSIEFEFQDDAEDRQATEIRGVRAQRRERDIKSKISNARTERQIMVTEGEISQQQFELMELGDGRLADGRDILTLFYEQGIFAEFLDLGVENPDNVEKNTPEELLPKIADSRSKILQAQAEATNQTRRFELIMANFALNRLEVLYKEKAMAEQAQMMAEQAGVPGEPGLPKGMEGDRIRTVDTLTPNDNTTTNNADGLRQSTDDTVKQAEDYLQKRIDEALERVDAALGGAAATEIEETSMMKFRKPFGRKGADYDEIALPGSVIRIPKQEAPIVHVHLPEQPPQVIVEQPKEVSVKGLEELVGHLQQQSRKETVAPTIQVNVPEAQPVIQVNVPEMAAPIVNVSPVLQMPDTEEVTEVVHDERGRVTKMIKRITALVKGR